jgi:hypothetical protein
MTDVCSPCREGRDRSSSHGNLILHHCVKLLSQFGAVGVAVSGDRMLGGSLQHFELPTRDRQRAVSLSGKIPAIDNFPHHIPLPMGEERYANSACAAAAILARPESVSSWDALARDAVRVRPMCRSALGSALRKALFGLRVMACP